MKLKFLFFLISAILCTTSFAQKKAIDWLSFEELAEHFQKEQKPILIFLHTDWCKFCKMQENTTFKDPSIISSLNKDYYCLRFNAENKETVSFFGREYLFSSEDGYHELAIYLGSEEGKLELPTTIILNRNLETSFRKSALVGLEEMKQLLEVP